MARSISAWVFFSILLLGSFVLQPALWRFEEGLGEAKAKNQMNRLVAMVASLSDEQMLDTLERTHGLVGAELFDGSYHPLGSIGGKPDILPGSYYREPLMINGRFVDVVWQLTNQAGIRFVTARLDARDIERDSREFLLQGLLLILILGLLAKVGTMFIVDSKVVAPLHEVINALRNMRDSGLKKPVQSRGNGRDEFSALVTEYNHMIESQISIERQVKMKQLSLEYLAHHDQLTHLPNRLQYKRRLAKAMKEAYKNNTTLAVFVLDLDHFKLFNDQYDQQTGDLMLAEVARRLSGGIRDEDTVGRLDGDEFIIINTDLHSDKEISELADRYLVGTRQPCRIRGMRFQITASIGVAVYSSGESEELQSPDELISNAIYALQEAKSGGRACYKIFNAEMRNKIVSRVTMEGELKTALEQGQFQLYYQPKVNIATREIVSSEALIRWIHPSKGFIRPDIFISVAEESGLMVALGDWILEEACSQVARWNTQGLNGMQVAVNLSAVQFQDPDLLVKVLRRLQKYKIPSSQLELEITESAIMSDPSKTIDLLKLLRKTGISLAIDDFGTGYSSLSYLKQFPVNTLKVDQAFVRNLESDADDKAIIEAVIRLGKHFKMKVVAEGIESEETMRLLAHRGCDVAQGYHISKPMPAADFTQWYLEHKGMFGTPLKEAQ